MKFSKDTLNILKNFSTIYSGIMLNPGNVILTRSVAGSSYAEATINDSIDIEAAIYDLNGFLSILSLVGEDAEVNMSPDKTTLVIKDKRTTINWSAADPSTITFPKKKIEFPVAEVIFELKGEDLQQIMRVARGLGVDTLAFTSTEAGKIVIEGYNKVVDSSMTKVLYSLVVGDNTEGKEFRFIFSMNNMKMIPADYKVLLWAQDKKFASKFEGPQASYVIASEAESTHNF